MPRVQIEGVNLNEVEAWDGASSGVLPIGEYVFDVTACTITNAKSSGMAQLEFDLTVAAGAATDACNGMTKKHWASLSPKAAARVRNLLDACGVGVDAEGGFDSDLFVGTQFIGEVFEDSYEKANLATGGTDTKTNNKIRKERPVSAGFEGQEAPAETAPATAAPRAPARPVAPAAPAAPARPLPPGTPRVAGATAPLPRPGVRAAAPARR
jgi:hypothetical protein